MKKILSTLLALLVIAAVITPSALATQTFNTTLNFTQSFSGQTRNYRYNHIRHIATASAPTAGATGENFSVALVRGSVEGAPAVGFANVPRNGASMVRFNSVGAGNYHFRYTRSNDGIRITSNDVVLQSRNISW